jgi:hypothetical protein
MNPFEMVIGIVLIITVGKVLSSRFKAKNGIIEVYDKDGYPQERLANATEQSQMAGEIAQLKERIKVLERIATDNHGSSDLKRQIEDLRDL